MKGGAPAAAEELLSSPYTLLATYKRVMSNGAFYAGKMMEYFFGGDRGYYQLPYFFRHFDKFLKVCHQYDSTVLMYLPNVSPYDLLVPHPSAPSLLGSIETYFTGLGITLDEGSIDIQAKIDKNVKHIQAIFDFCINDFMVDSRDADDESIDGMSVSESDDNSSISSSINAAEQLLDDSLRSNDSSGSFKQDSELYSPDGMDSPRGGTLPIKYHIRKSITTRKNKNKNKPRTKSKTPARRITIRIKRLIKSKVTKPKTYKRRATGGKRKSKPNKTMRRYRRVRK